MLHQRRSGQHSWLEKRLSHLLHTQKTVCSTHAPATKQNNSLTKKSMSQIDGLVYFMKREGQDGKIGPVFDVVQLAETSPMIAVLEERNYYKCSKEEWEKETGLVAGDMDGDGDLDHADRVIIAEVNEQVAEETAGAEEAKAEHERVEEQA